MVFEFGHLILCVFFMNFEGFDDSVSGMDVTDQVLDFSVKFCSLLVMAVGFDLQFFKIEL